MQQQWKSTVMNIIYSIIIYAVAGILAGVFGAFGTLNSTANALKWVFFIIEIGGFVWYFMNLTKFITLQKNDADSAAVSGVRLAYIISIVGVLLSMIPAVGWIFGLICSIVSLVLLIINFGKLSNSTILPQGAKEGANLLKVSVIVSLVGAVLGIIPAVGWIFALLCGIVSIVLLFMGWSKVAANAPA